MNNHPGTKVRRRQNSNYKCGHANLTKPRPRTRSPRIPISMADRHGNDNPNVPRYERLMRGLERA